MIIGGNKDKVIENIKKSVEEGNYNTKVEVDDPDLSQEQKDKLVNDYVAEMKTKKFKVKNIIAEKAIRIITTAVNKDTEIIGIENIKDIKTGALVTSNHFNPLDNTIIRKVAKKAGKKNLYIISQETNLAMTGIVGFFMNYSNIIPIASQVGYMKKIFPKLVSEKLKENNFILIYPEQEMWFNYRKPRTLKSGAYYYAAKNNVPVISCFVEMIDTDKSDNEEFYKVKHIAHVLEPIYPDSSKSPKENSIIMMEKDYEQKKEAYEKAYNKKLDYAFSEDDIAGWKRK